MESDMLHLWWFLQKLIFRSKNMSQLSEKY